MSKLTIYNSQDHVMTIQMEPSAITYDLAGHSSITFIQESATEENNFRIEFDSATFCCLYLSSDDDFFIERNGNRYHCRDYSSD